MSVSWGGGKQVSTRQNWKVSGSKEWQVQEPASKKDLEIRARSDRTGKTIADGFSNMGLNVFGAATHLLNAAATGQRVDMAQLMEAAKFDPKQLTSDLRKIATDLQKNPMDTAQNLILGAPTDAIQGGLESLEKQTGLRKDFQGQFSTQAGDFSEYRFRQQMGVLGEHTNRTRTMVGGSAQGQGNLTVGLAGVRGQGSVEARAGAAVETDGKLQGAWGQASYNAKAGVEVYGKAQGDFSLNARGLQGKARAEVGVMASAEASASFQTAGINIGGERLDLRGQGTVRVEAGAKAEANLEVNATISPPRANVDIGGRAFAGAKAEARGQIGIGGFATLKGQAGVWAGAGAEAGVKLGYKDGKISFGFNAGAAAGYGFGAGWGVEVDVKKLANAAVGAGVQAAVKGIDYALHPEKAVLDAVKTVTTIEKTVDKVTDAVDKGVTSVVKSAAKAASSMVRGAAKAINNVIKKFRLW